MQKQLSLISVENPDWSRKSVLLASKSTQPLSSLWLYEHHKGNMLLADNPFKTFPEAVLEHWRYSPRWGLIPSPHGEYAARYYRASDFGNAALHLEKAETRAPENLYILLNLAFIYEKAQKYSHSRERLELALKRVVDEETRTGVLMWLIRICYRQGSLEAAENYVERLKKAYLASGSSGLSKQDRMRMRQNLATLLNTEGIILYRQGKWARAFNIFGKLGNDFPGSFAFSFNKNKILLEKRRYETSLKTANAMIQSLAFLIEKLRDAPGSPLKQKNIKFFEELLSLTLRRKGEILYREKHYGDALEVFERAVGHSDREPISWYRMALIHAREKDFDQALISFRKVILHSSQNSKIHQDALKWLDKIFNEQAVEAIAKEDPEVKKRDEFFQTLSVDDRERILEIGDVISISRSWLRQGKIRKLVKTLKKLVGDYRDVAEISYLLGRAYQELGLRQLAKHHYSRALETDPRHLPSLVSMTYYFALEKNYSKATVYLKRMEGLDSSHHEVLGARGWLFYQKGEFEKSIDWFQRAIESSPSFASHHYHLGMAYLRMHLYAFALHKFDDALSAGYPISRVLLLKGLANLYLGRTSEGESAIQAAISHAKDNPKIIRFARRVLKGARSGEKLPSIDSSLLVDTRQFEVRAKTYSSLQDSMQKVLSGKTLEAIEDLRERLKKDPKNSTLLHVIAFLHLLVEREDLADEYFRLALDRNPKDYRAMNSLSELEFRRGKIDQCLLYWEEIKRVSPLIETARILDDLGLKLKEYMNLNPDDEWAVYAFSLLKLHTRKEDEALDVLEKIRARTQERSSDYRSRLRILQGQILYKLGILQEKPDLIQTSAKLLTEGGYRYVDLLKRYEGGIRSLLPEPVVEKKVVQVSSDEISFLNQDQTLRAVRKPVVQSVSLRSRARPLRHWRKLDRVLSKKQPRKVKSSYDLFLEKRLDKQENYIDDLERYSGANRDRAPQEDQQNKREAETALIQSLQEISKGDLEAARSRLLDAVNARVDFEEAYYGLVFLDLLQGRFKDLATLLPILKSFEDYSMLWKLIQAHLQFHQGEFQGARNLWEGLAREIQFPDNRTYKTLVEIYTQVVEQAPGDLEPALRLGLLHHLGGRFEDSVKALRGVGAYPGLVPYICEPLILKGLVERRREPVKKAVKLMRDFVEVRDEEQWLSLAKSMDSFLLSYRFLAR